MRMDLEELPTTFELGILALLILLSAFFAGTETALMALNRYRLRHMAKAGHRGARLAERLLARPDRLIGMILIGNLVTIESATLMTADIAERTFGHSWVTAGAIAL